MTGLKILVAAAGSHGDVLPFIALCRELRARGHRVCLYASGFFARHAEEAGIPFRSIGDASEHLARLRDPDLRHPFRGHRVIARALAAHLADVHEAMRAEVEPGRTLVISSVLAFPARLLRDTDRVPCVMVHLSPTTLRSLFDSPRMLARDPLYRSPAWVKSLAWSVADRLVLQPLYGSPLNRYRSQLGLAPVKRLFGGWLNDADLVVALFPDWFAAPQSDWSTGLCQTGFPLYDHGDFEPLAAPLLRFLEAGDPPVAFTAGTAVASANAFFAESVAACLASGRRGLLLTHRPEQLPPVLPSSVANFHFAPFGSLLPRVAALVHHGGIGTTSQALRAGVPQLVSPLAYDQFDNSMRVGRLGVGAELLPRHFRAATVNTALDGLLNDPTVRRRCADAAARLVASDAVPRTCDAILGTLADEFGAPARPA